MVREYTGEIERPVVDDSVYAGTITKISDIYEGKSYHGEVEERLRVEVTLESGETLSSFMTAVVSYPAVPGTRVQKSKLYELLRCAGVTVAYEKERDNIFASTKSAEEQNGTFVDFLRKQLAGRKVQVQTRTMQPQNGESYSVISSILAFVDNEQDAGAGAKGGAIPEEKIAAEPKTDTASRDEVHTPAA